MKGCPVSALFYALGGFTFLKFVVKTLFVFSETFILSGTSVSGVMGEFTALAYISYYQLKKFGAGKGSWAGKQTQVSVLRDTNPQS